MTRETGPASRKPVNLAEGQSAGAIFESVAAFGRISRLSKWRRVWKWEKSPSKNLSILRPGA